MTGRYAAATLVPSSSIFEEISTKLLELVANAKGPAVVPECPHTGPSLAAVRDARCQACARA